MADITRATDEGDPNRCQGVVKHGQCPNMAALKSDGTYSKHCIMHGGAQEKIQHDKQQASNYRLTRWKASLDRQTSNSSIKSLRDEIGILRILMEETLNRCEDETSLLIQAATISDLATKIERIVSSCHKLEGSMGELIDRKAIIAFAQEILAILSRHLKGQETLLELISGDLLAATSRVGRVDSEAIDEE